jgi:polyhydroxyalkanoate synthase
MASAEKPAGPGRRAAASARAAASRKPRQTPDAAGGPSADPGSPAGGAASGFAMPELRLPPGVRISPARLAELQSDYLKRCQELIGSGLQHAGPALSDRRFAGEAWRDGGPYTWTASLYLLNAEFLRKMAEAVEADEKTHDRIRFATQQWVDMVSPANFLVTNPEAQKRLIDTRGESLRVGLENLFSDLEKGRISQTDEEAFEVGRNVATSPGSVVFQNELIQIVQYAPSTPRVGSRPLLMVPPCINKFYIMDLQPDNSLVAYAVSQGHTVFMLSWRNVGAELGHLTWDDYLEQGVFEAIRVVREISGADRINALGFCVGGTILGAALAALAARGERPVAALTLMTTLLDFAEAGSLGLFIDENFVRYREQTLGSGGILKGSELAATFSFLRPNDLVWNYVVSNYLKGDRPPAFDLLYWNSDSTNLPGPMYAWYLRHMYLQNELRMPDRLVCAGQPIDLRRIGVPTYIFGAREDHIVLWRAAYGSTQLLDGPVRFVLGASGHIAGAINPVSKNKRSYWTGPDHYPADPQAWLDTAAEHPGSWWQDWAAWLAPHKGSEKPAPAVLGSRRHKPVEPAPGSYVKAPAP